MRGGYTARERFWLWTLAVVGLVVVNGAFLYGTFVRPESIREAMTNPVGAAFAFEAFLMLCALTYLLPRWGVARLGRLWFVVLSLLGSMAFALPVILLWHRRSSASNGGELLRRDVDAEGSVARGD